MPAALSTTKRKFHKLLDSISNVSSTSLATHHDKSAAESVTTLPGRAGDPRAKKSRLERPTSSYAPRSAGMGPPLKQSSMRPRSIAATQTRIVRTTSKHEALPNFAPWDRGQFLSRLKTYRHVDKWMGKPDKINEVEWARRGWSCVGKERTGCVGGCGAEVVIKLEGERETRRNSADEKESEVEDDEDDWRDQAQVELVGKYADMISSAHEEGCLWRRRGCDDTIQRLPLVHQAIALDGLRLRYQSLLKMASELPSAVTTPKTFDAPRIIQQATAVLSTPPTTNGGIEDTSTSSTPEETNQSALFLALFGWQAEENHIAGLATCNACFRRLGLWLFKKPSSEDCSSESSMDRLDVVGEHRDYCPWVSPLAQNGGNRRSSLDGLAGWEMLLRAVAARADREKEENETASMTRRESLVDDASEVGTFVDSVAATEDEQARDERERERWARLKRMKQIFQVKKRPKSNGIAAVMSTEKAIT